MTESIAERPRRAPTHPGAILREDVLPALGISVTAMAKHLHVTRQQLHRIRREGRHLAGDGRATRQALRQRPEPVA